MKHPVYGLEQPYLEQLRKELLIYTDDAFLDGFSNLIAKRNGTKEILAAFCASENAFLVSEIKADGKGKVSPLFSVDEALSGSRVLSPNGRQGIFDAKENTVDFFVSDEKQALRLIKPGDVIYLKPFCETVGDSYLTNQPAFFLKQIFSDFLKTTTAKLSVALVRETKKGAHALGKNYPADEAYFITCAEKLPHPVCFLKKEGDFVSPMEVSQLPAFISQKELTVANSYFVASGCNQVCGIAIQCEKLPAGQVKIKKETVKELFAFLASLQ